MLKLKDFPPTRDFKQASWGDYCTCAYWSQWVWPACDWRSPEQGLPARLLPSLPCKPVLGGQMLPADHQAALAECVCQQLCCCRSWPATMMTSCSCSTGKRAAAALRCVLKL